MTIIYSQDFESTALGSLPSGWTASNSSPFSAGSPWSVENTIVADGTKSAGGPTDFSAVFCTAAGALADMELTYDVKQGAGFINPLLRMSSDGQNGYFIGAEDATLSKFNFYKLVGGVFTSMTEITNNNPVGVANQSTPVSVRVRVQGQLIEIKTWLKGSAEPAAWGASYTDSSNAVTTPGYFGFVSGNSGGAMSGLDSVNLDNLAVAATDFTFGGSPQTTPPGVATGNYTITPNATPSASTTIALSDGGAGGTFTPSSLTFTTATAQTFTYTPAAGATSSPITLTATASGGFSATHTGQCILNIPATNLTLSPSSQGTTAGTASPAYSVTLNGTLSSNETVALSDGGAGGSFSPSSLTFTSGNAGSPQTFTYTPAAGAAGSTITLTATASGQFSASKTASCVVTAGPQTIAVTNASLFWSPGNWDHLTSGTFGVSRDTMQATAPGAYLKFKVTGTANLTLDIDNSTTSSFASGSMPVVRYSIDGGNFVDVRLDPSATQLVLSSNLATGSVHTVQVWLREYPLSHDAWGSSGVSPANVLRINGIVIDGGATISAPDLLAKRALFFGDSMTQGEHALDDQDDSTQAWTPIIAQIRGLEYGQIGYGGTGWETTGAANMPKFMTSYPLYSVGRSRSLSGLDEVWVFHGYNDGANGVSAATIQADCQAWLAAMRTACGPNTVFFVCSNPQGTFQAALAAAVAAYKASSSDTKVYQLSVSSLFPAGAFGDFAGVGPYQWTWDGTHPTVYGHARLGAAYAAAAAAATAAGGTTGGVRRSGFSGGFLQ